MAKSISFLLIVANLCIGGYVFYLEPRLQIDYGPEANQINPDYIELLKAPINAQLNRECYRVTSGQIPDLDRERINDLALAFNYSAEWFDESDGLMLLVKRNVAAQDGFEETSFPRELEEVMTPVTCPLEPPVLD
ncbi:MAG: hypothetical protein VW645_10010 [Betaproteobacteria bacterium]